ncbi:hypothetical protein [Thiomicrorhabdus aquaedulcis]|uniref:hypothetical protein n=1 Tax=Thiomicrorhabdus aquaedulcis TaxID=2211106 RepID=UPI000FDBBA97|nr:hypothetical protein [Thiomicrorhabdus aquaedulcis]
MKPLIQAGLVVWFGFGFSGVAMADFSALSQAMAAPNPEPTPEKVEELNQALTQSNPNLKTLLLTQGARAMIDQQRANYLNPEAQKVQKQPEEKAVTPKRVAENKVSKPRVASQNVAVSAVIIKPDGSSLVRVNNQYNPTNPKGFALNYQDSNADGVPIMVQGKVQRVPVGSTLITGKNQVVPSYQLQRQLQTQKRQAAVPKTEEKAAKEALQSVRIINATE